MRNRVFILLFMALIVVGLIPLVANSVLVDDILLSQQKIYHSAELTNVLDSYQGDLKKLSKEDPENEGVYRQQFDKIQDLKLIYGEDTYFSETIRATTSKYFFIVFGVALAVSLILGSILSLKVNSLYLRSFDDLNKEREKSRYLNDIAKWQEVAQKLAHEIRRPLQPIRIWVSQLRKQDSFQNETVFEAVKAIDQEVLFLSDMVSGFSEFASIPKPNMEMVDLETFVRSFISQYKNIWSNVCFSLKGASRVLVSIDPKIFRMLITNLVENAVEANPECEVSFNFSFLVKEKIVTLSVFNSGIPLSDDERKKIFDIYFSTKSDKKNKGLGLAIVKTVALEHGGDIQCVDVINGVQFDIQLPLARGQV